MMWILLSKWLGEAFWTAVSVAAICAIPVLIMYLGSSR